MYVKGRVNQNKEVAPKIITANIQKIAEILVSNPSPRQNHEELHLITGADPGGGPRGPGAPPPDHQK